MNILLKFCRPMRDGQHYFIQVSVNGVDVPFNTNCYNRARDWTCRFIVSNLICFFNMSESKRCESMKESKSIDATLANFLRMTCGVFGLTWLDPVLGSSH